MSNHTPHAFDVEAPSSKDAPAGPSRYSRTSRPVWGALWRTLMSMVAMFVFAVVGALGGLQLARVLGAPERSEVMFAGVGSLTVGVAVVVVLRRFVEGDRSISLGMAWGRGRALLWLALGIGAAAVVLGFGIADQFLSGTASVEFADLPAGDIVLGMLSLLAVAFLLQGIPEELLFRGYLQGTLAERLPVWTAVVISGVAFGVLHLVSQGSGDTVSSKLIYVLSATGLGFAAGGLRAVTGSTWAAIGLHGGDHLVTGVSQLWLRMDDEHVSLWSTAALFAICGICLVVHARRVKAARLDDLAVPSASAV
ncbi:MAG: type II CAAX endopeptidase family protein [Ornithinimicrobium sp.]|uniref:CPBP family intramembrane glutamic endopeptidase n=1 Tax=Ornithinimicrobium sp. TaxID=1977084 RepID=UPI0026E0F723|nr:type II CAAX endopeptidase family protein [Ornithinimicrobium sp.]MDO5739963.1 type II CAAX endopeptidase family protein [Ornithinimicrobium sp.]